MTAEPHHDAPERPDAPNAPEETLLRDLFHRSWEMELLISGGVVFALFQIPEALDQAWIRWDSRAGGSTFIVGFFVYYYVKLILYTLLTTFMFQLVVRAYWIGLLGLNGVFPDGPDWEEVKQGPHSKKQLRSLCPSLPIQIRRADSVASVLFAAGFSTVGIFVWSILGSGILALATLLLSGLLFGGDYGQVIFWTLFLGFGLAMLLPQLVDRAFGKRLAEDGLPARWIRATARLGWKTGFRFYIPTWLTISSNVRSRATGVAVPIIMTALVGFFLVRDIMIPEGRLRSEGGAYFPDRGSSVSVDPAHYDDQLGLPLERTSMPSIGSELAQGEHVRLFLPYRPTSQDDLIEAICPGIAPLRDDKPRLTRSGDPGPSEEAAATALGCLASLWRVRLDGAPVSALDPIFGRRGPYGQDGLVTYLPIRDLASGRHLIEVDRLIQLPGADGETDRGVAGSPSGEWRTYFIPFWK